MTKIQKIKLGSHPRGDSGFIRWSWKKQGSNGELTKLSLVGYKASLTVKQAEHDSVTNDSGDGEGAVKGFNNTEWKVDIDCDNPTQMRGINPTEGQILFPIHKQATWLEPGTYNVDIVLENKASKATTTVMIGEIEIQGHPTNRLTTDAPDNPAP